MSMLVNSYAVAPSTVPITSPYVTNRTTLQRVAAQSIPNATITAVSWDTALEDPPGAWSAGSPTLVTVPTGKTRAKAHVHTSWVFSTSGTRWAWLTYAAGTSYNADIRLALNEASGNFTTEWFPVTAGQTMIVYVQQDTGSAKNLAGPIFGGYSYIQVEWE